MVFGGHRAAGKDSQTSRRSLGRSRALDAVLSLVPSCHKSEFLGPGAMLVLGANWAGQGLGLYCCQKVGVGRLLCL